MSMMNAARVSRTVLRGNMRASVRSLASSATAADAPYCSMETKDGVAIVRLNDPSSRVNTLNKNMMNEFTSVLDSIESDASVRSVVLISGKPDCFIAGADIEMLADAKTVQEATQLATDGQAIMNRIAASKKPFVAAINGSCLGGGLEVALACHHRIATSHPKTKLGLPEVQLGLLPGAGGTQRLPRLIGAQKALPLITTGKQLDATRAKRQGIVNSVADPFALEHAAVQAAQLLAEKGVKARKVPLLEKAIEGNPLGRNFLFSKAREMGEKQARGNYPAIPAIFDVVEAALAEDEASGMKKEAEAFGRLVMTPESASLRSIFFGSTALKKNPMGKPKKPAQTMLVLGAGLMGAGIAEVSSQKAKMRVLMKDRDTAALARGEKQIKDSLDQRVKRRAVSAFDRDRMMSSVVGLTDEDEVWKKHLQSADIAIEAVPEDLKIKHRVIEEMEQYLPEHAVFATNTSALPIADVAKASKRPENVIGMHYFSPVPKMPLLEIIRHEGTSDETAAIAYDAGMRQGKTCVLVKDVPGFYVNRSLGPYMAECMALIQDGVDPEHLDKIMLKYGFPMGPVALSDEVGIDVAAHVADFLGSHLGDRMLGADAGALQDMVKQGKLGRKAGEGFFSYDKKGKRQGIGAAAKTIIDQYRTGRPQTAKDLSDDDLVFRMYSRFVNEAAFCLQDDIIRGPVDGDIAAVFGIGYPPFRGGPFRTVDTLGASTFVDRMRSMQDKFGPQFAPAPILVDMAKSGKKFHAR